MTVDAGDHIIESRQQVVVVIEPAVGQNVALRPLEKVDALQMLIEIVNGGLLLTDARVRLRPLATVSD